MDFIKKKNHTNPNDLNSSAYVFLPKFIWLIYSKIQQWCLILLQFKLIQ